MPSFEKSMYLANFNITFGADEHPMLEYFMDVIYPAFCSNLKRGNSKKRPAFYFEDVKIKEYNNNLVMVGNYIKDTKYEILTTVKNGKLISSPNSVPTAPYSRFIIFLRNHRMVLVKNESSSPDIRSFQTTVNSFFIKYIMMLNKEIHNKEDKIPAALVNIVNIPLSNNIDSALKDVKKITELRFRFFPLNNDINFNPLSDNVDMNLKKIKSKRAYLTFPSPESIDDVKEIMRASSGLADFRLKVQYENNDTTTIQEDKFATNKKISLNGDISEKNDIYIINTALENETINVTSEANNNIFNKFKEKIKELIQ